MKHHSGGMEKKYPTLEENSMKMWLIKYMHVIELELELELILLRWLWERGEKGVEGIHELTFEPRLAIA